MRQAITLAALLLLAAPARAAAAPHEAAAWSPVPLSAIGLDGYVRRKWRDPSLTLRYRTRVDRIVTGARLRLRVTPGKLDGITALTVKLNGVGLAELAAADLREGQEREIQIEPRLMTMDNQLTLAFSAPRKCVAAGTWALISAESVLEVQQARLRGHGDLAQLPLPFFDPQLDVDVEVPFVLAGSPSPAVMRAAFVLAGAFALAAPARVRFPVRLGALPEGNAVVVGSRAELAALGVRGDGVVENPRGGQLLVAAGEGDELERAVGALADRLTAGAPGGGLELGHLAAFSSLAPAERLIVRGRQDGEITMRFSLPPAAVFWRDAGLPVTLLFEESVASDAPPSKLVVLLNGEYVTTLKRGRRRGVREARFRLPQALLQRHNQLIVSRELEQAEGCPAPHADEYFAISGESMLDLRRATQIATLPDLALLATSGFPFTRAADLEGTAVVVPESAGPRTLSVMLGLAGRLARLAGSPATGASFLGARAVPAGLDRDLIVVGAAGDQPLLSGWRDRLPVQLSEEGAVALRTVGPIERLERLIEDNGRPAFEPAQLAGVAHPGLVASFESPLKRGRTVLVVTAADEAALPDPAILDDPRSGRERADTWVVSDGKRASLSLAARYVVGQMGWSQRVLWYLSLRPWLLVLFLIAGAWFAARAVIGRSALRARRRLMLALLLMALGTRAHADEPAATQLTARAHFWEAQGRVDKAVEVWQQLLRLEPDNPTARAGLARCRGPRPGAADEALDRSVSAARALAAAGRYDEAVAAYRKVVGLRPPEHLALEYYDTLAGTVAGRAEAESALAKLVREHPDVPELALAHARALTYDQRTRAAGIAELERLAQIPSVARDAAAALARARSWAATSGPVRGGLLKIGYALLGQGEVDRAAAAFERAIAASPRDAEALVGLSWVRVKQSRFADARALAVEARQLAPLRRELWSEPMRVSSLWVALHEATEAEQRRDWPTAADQLLRALEASPQDATLVNVRRGELLLLQGRAAEAEQLLRPLVASAPLDALPGLIEALLRQGRSREANQLVQEALDRRHANDAEARRFRIAIARARARAAAARGDDAAALARLREALELDPDDQAMQLALLYRELDADLTAPALALGEKLRRQHGDEPEVLAALAAAQLQDGRPDAAKATLGAVPPARLSRAGRELRDRLELLARVHDALELRPVQRLQRLDELETDAALDADDLAIVADAWAKAGRRDRALTSVRKALAQAPSRGARLRCAGVLLGLGPMGEVELQRLLDGLDGEPDLSTRERHLLERARTALLIRQTDQDRQAGELRRAFLRLEPALKATPDDTSLLSALARLQSGAGHPAAALATWRRLVQREPQDLSFTEGAAFAAMASGEREQARSFAASALKLHPREPRAYLLAGKIAVARGDDHLGHQILTLGLERWRQQAPTDHPSDPDPSGSATLLADARTQLLGEEPPPEEEAPVDKSMQAEQARIDVRHAPALGGGITFRYRSGEPGFSRLFEVDLPVVLQFSPRRWYGRFTARMVPTYLTAQATDLNNPAVADVFGTNGINTPTTLPRRLSTDVWGFGMSLRYDLDGFFAELGCTPLGFQVVDAIGQVGWVGNRGPWSFGIRLFRTPVIDSVLSFSGLVDPRTGLVWGGVRREGGQLDLDFDPGEYVIHLYGSYAAYTGKRVEGNHGGQYDLTGMWRLYRRPRQTIALGLDLFIAHWAENLRFFTFGQGGYFSPQFFLFAGIPLTWEMRADGWTLHAAGAAGVNWYQESASPMFPADGALQFVREMQPNLGMVFHDASFGGSEHVSAFGRIQIGVSHELRTHLFVEGSFEGQFGPAYSEILLTFALRNVFL